MTFNITIDILPYCDIKCMLKGIYLRFFPLTQWRVDLNDIFQYLYSKHDHFIKFMNLFHAYFKIYNSMIKSILSSILQLYVKYLKNALLTAGISLIFKLPWKVLYCFALVSAEMLQSKFALETNICSLYFFNFAFYKNMQMCNMFYANKAGNIS